MESHLDQLEGETLVEDAVDPGPARQLVGVDLVPRALDAFLKVHRELLHHPGEGGREGERERGREGGRAQISYAAFPMCTHVAYCSAL